jgi:hypothetical protein
MPEAPPVTIAEIPLISMAAENTGSGCFGPHF